jgi:hypothetical protein
VRGLAAFHPADVSLDLIPNEFARSFPNRPEDLVNLVPGFNAKGFIGIGRLSVDTQGEIDRDLHATHEGREAGTTTLLFVTAHVQAGEAIWERLRFLPDNPFSLSRVDEGWQ